MRKWLMGILILVFLTEAGVGYWLKGRHDEAQQRETTVASREDE